MARTEAQAQYAKRSPAVKAGLLSCADLRLATFGLETNLAFACRVTRHSNGILALADTAQADLYRSYAEACIRLASAAHDEAERARWVEMAQHWLDWADRERRNLPLNGDD